jgi:4-amino-4-deoxy-L-arabinose transferase-like glycosyltransferase
MPVEISALLGLLFSASCALAVFAMLGVWSKTARGSSASPDWSLALFLAVVSVVIFVGWIGVILASFNLFSVGLISIALSVGAGLLVWRFKLTGQLRFGAPTRYELGLGVLLLGCAVVYFRPHEYVLGGTDAGTYMNVGVTIARTGRFVIHDEWPRFLSEDAPVTLREQPSVYRTRWLQFVGYYLDDTDAARVIPQFLPFHPVLIAIGVSVGGVWGGLLVTPLWGVLGLAAVYFVTRKAFDAPIALLATTLLALTPTHIYFARYPTTEPLTLLLIFTGLLAFQTLWDDRTAGIAWGIFGGAAFGAALLTRIDLTVVLVLVVVALSSARLRHQWSRSWTAFVMILGAFIVHLILDVILINWPYFWNTYGGVFRVLSQALWPIAFGTLGMIGLVVAAVVAARRGVDVGNRVARWVNSSRARWLLVASIIVLSAYAYFLRPVLEPIRMATSWPGNVQFPILDGQNWVRIGWYITPLGILLATVGLAYLVRRAALTRLGLFLAVGVLTTIQYVYNIFNTSYQIYAMRRYVPIVLPMLMIYAAVAIVAIWRARPSRWVRLLGGGLALGLMAGLVYQARFVVVQRDFFGAVEQLTQLNAHLQPDAIVILNEPSASTLSDAFGVPLQFMFGHAVATVHAVDDAAVPFVERLLAYADAHQRPVQVLAVDPIAPGIRETLQLRPRAVFSVTLSALASTYYDYPSVNQPSFYGFEIYDVTGRRSNETQAGPLVIDVGGFDTAYIRSGFYGKEILLDGTSARWTEGEAIVDIPTIANAPVTIGVRAMTFRPVQVPAAPVTVWLGDQVIGQFTPNEAWQTWSFHATSHSTTGLSSLRFTTETFNPAGLQLSADNRDLGFLIDRISVTPQR